MFHILFSPEQRWKTLKGFFVIAIERARLHKSGKHNLNNTQPCQSSVQLSIQNTAFVNCLFTASYVFTAAP
jgi:hypothetical protein